MWPKLALLLAGIGGTLFPEECTDTMKQLLLRPSYENPEDLEPRTWVVKVVRIQSFLMVLIGLYLLFVDGNEHPNPVIETPDITPSSPEES